MNEMPLTGLEILLLLSPLILAGFGVVIYTLWKADQGEKTRAREFKEAKKSGFLK